MAKLPNDDSRAMRELLSNLTAESIQQAIRFVREADFKTVEIDDLKAALFEMLRAYGCYAKSISEGVPLFRAMKHKADEDRFANLSRIYPDPKFLTTLGRANREHRPIFYLSGDHVIAFHEVKAKTDDVISLLECRPRDSLSPILIPIGIDALLNKHGVKAAGEFPENSIRIDDLLEHDGACLEKYWRIDTFLTSEFLKDVPEGQSHEYKSTVAIAELLFSFATEDRPIDGLAYPSIAGLHANLALLPESFYRIYHPFACQRIKINGYLDNSGFSLDPGVGIMADGIDSAGSIRWPKT